MFLSLPLHFRLNILHRLENIAKTLLVALEVSLSIKILPPVLGAVVRGYVTCRTRCLSLLHDLQTLLKNEHKKHPAPARHPITMPAIAPPDRPDDVDDGE